MNPNSLPDLFEIPNPAELDISESRDGKRMAWLAALALMAVVAGATLALLDDTPKAAPQVAATR